MPPAVARCILLALALTSAMEIRCAAAGLPAGMCVIPAGTYVPLQRSDRDPAEVPVAAFLLDTYPVTNADYLAFGHTVGRKTIFRGIERLPGATCLVFRHGELDETRYWRPLPPHTQAKAETADLEEVRQLFNRSVERTLAAGGDTCLALTGGMDARAILSAMVAKGMTPQTLTHSLPDSTDACLSAELARRAGARHHFFEVRGEMLPEHFRPGAQLLGGLVAGVDVHPLCFLDALTQFTHVVITGLGADVMRLDHAGVDIVPGRDTPQVLIEDIRRYHNAIFDTNRELPALLDPAAASGDVLDPVRSIVEYVESRLPDIPLDEIGGAFFLEERVPMIWVKGDLIVRRELETRHPFLDPDLLIRAWAFPRPARLQSLAHRYTITRNAPPLADVPYERDGLPLRHPFTAAERWRWSLQRRQRQLAAKVGQRWERRPNYRYADWFRGPLQPLLAEVLLDARTLSRPYFRPGVVRRLFDEHMAGRDHTVRLAALLLWALLAIPAAILLVAWRTARRRRALERLGAPTVVDRLFAGSLEAWRLRRAAGFIAAMAVTSGSVSARPGASARASPAARLPSIAPIAAPTA